MLAILLLGLAGCASQCQAQVSFKSTTAKPKVVNTRLGLLANTHLGIDPVASGSSSSGNGGGGGGQTASLSGSQASGRVPQGGEFGQQCCCVPFSEQCGDPSGFGGPDLVGLGIIDPRLKNNTAPSISTRIVVTPIKQEPIRSCPEKTCCYDADIDLSVLGVQCQSPEEAHNLKQGVWRQPCTERPVSGGPKPCGTRTYNTYGGADFGESSPGEFPWTCLLLNQNNDFIGSCALIPNSFSNNNGATRKVITAAHKLKDLGASDLLKVRVGEYDASGFNRPETVEHDEYTVVKILKHPSFSPKRLSGNIALLTLDRDVNLRKPTVNTVCLPTCDQQFDFRFNNGTGTRCWVAGWGKDKDNGSFQFIQHKVDVPLVERNNCSATLRQALSRKTNRNSNFVLDESELCAGAEVGKDACTGDGGSPLVCQAQSGRWTVVGLVTWGVGCASDIPGVYTRISHFRNFINNN